MKKRIVSFPRIGQEYTIAIENALESLGLNVLPPPEISDKTISLGVKLSSDMMCFPYKVTLGNFIEVLEQGANTLFMYDSKGQCRLRHYHKLHEFTLKKLGYKFELFPINKMTILPTLKKISGKSYISVFRTVKNLVKKIQEIDRSRYIWSSEMLNIGIIGEIYTCCEEMVNYRIEEKLKKLGVNPYNLSCLSEFIAESLKGKILERFGKSSYKEKAKKYLNGPLGGHAFENIYNLLYLVDKRIDGVIHLLPLSCMPESTIEPFIDAICQDANTPLLRLYIDETNSEANIDTRLETFVELVKRKQKVVSLEAGKNEMLVRN
jgi:predicted nucleotide-binding protein (sugar kinase/HSP70/actin superfamily)